MTPLTMEQANLLLDDIKTPDEMRALIRRLDIRAQGDVTILYSGMLGFHLQNKNDGVMAVDVVRSFVNNKENIRAVDTTEAARFLGVDPSLQNRNKPALDALERIFGTRFVDGSIIYHFLYGDVVNGERVPNGVWDDISERFVADTVGEIVTLTGGANFGRAFAQSEIPAILKSNTITHVDGIPIEILKSYGHYGAYKAITAQSETRAAELRIALDEAGNALKVDGYVVIDARNYLAHTATSVGKDPPIQLSRAMHWVGEMIPDERIRGHAEGITLLREAQFEMKRQLNAAQLLDPLPANNIALRNLSRFGMAADVLSLALVALDAKAAYQAGDKAKARQIITDWAIQNLSAFAAGRVAALAFTPLLAAGPAGVVLYGALTIGASIGGGLYGTKLINWLKRYLDPWNQEFKYNWLNRTEFRSPLVLDLDGDGVETLNLNSLDIFFDHDGNGFAERTGWAAPDDGLLARDLNGDGQITTGSELFGNFTLSPSGSSSLFGFLALSDLDENRDGCINLSDSVFNSLFIWKDINSNARLDQGEAFSLESLAVTSLSTRFQWSDQVDIQGNLHQQLGSYSKADGTSAGMNDVWFKINRVDTVYRDVISVSEAISRLPDIPGLGNVYSLHHEMARDSSGQLLAVVERWVNANSHERDLLLDELIARWAGVYDLVPTFAAYSRRETLMYATTERFAGRNYKGSPAEVPFWSNLFGPMYYFLRPYIREQLVFEADVVPFLGALALQPRQDGGLGPDISGMLAYMRAQFALGSEMTRQLEISRFIKKSGISDLFAVIRSDIRQAALMETGLFSAYLMLLSADNWECGGVGNDWLISVWDNNLLQGLEGNDTLWGGTGMDTLEGGPGNDVLRGGGNNDIYLYARGDGKDIIQTSLDGTPNHHNILYFRPGIDVADLRLQSIGNDGSVRLVVAASDDQITINTMVVVEQRYDYYSPVQEFVFADGTHWSYQDFLKQLFSGSAFDDVIRGSYDADLICGQDGMDHLTGGIGDDTLMGGNGNDMLFGGFGSDVLFGDAGDDQIYGGAGSDLYVIGRDNGRDLIDDQWFGGDATNRIRFMAGITTADVSLRRDETNLYIEIFSSNDFIEIPFVFMAFASPVSVEPLRIEFADSTVWSFDAICELLTRGNECSQIIYGYGTGDRIDAAGGDDWISGVDGSDSLSGAAGDDTIFGGNGGDTLDGGPGKDQLDGGTGNDLLLGGDGDDSFVSAVLNNGRDTIYAGLGDDLFIGAKGVELFFGEAGNDTAFGGAGSDTLNGGDGSDSLAGGDGDDCLWAGLAVDTLSGGAGADRFLFLHPDEAGLGVRHHDVITDFQVGDRIDLSSIDANNVLLGDQSFRFIGESRFSGLGQLRYSLVDGHGLLEANCAGRLDADFQITILGAAALDPSSFIL